MSRKPDTWEADRIHDLVLEKQSLQKRISTLERCARAAYEKLQPLVSFEEWVRQFDVQASEQKEAVPKNG